MKLKYQGVFVYKQDVFMHLKVCPAIITLILYTLAS